MTTIPISVSTDDAMLAAMLRLIGAAGLTIAVDAIERPAADEAERLLLSVELPTLKTSDLFAIDASVGTSVAGVVKFDHDDEEAIDPQAGLALLPPDPDAVFRPRSADEYTDERSEADLQLLAVSRLGENPALSDVVRHLLKPLAGKGWPTDGNSEAVLTRLAEEFCTYPPRMLAAAAQRLLNGRHSHFPDQAEIFEAIGRAMRPGSATREAA